VYRVTNTAIGAQYIGSTTRAFAARWGEHIAYLEAGTHSNKAWQRDWQIYGPDAFSFTVLESSSADEDRIRDREQDWINAVRHELPPHLVYNREGFRSAKPSSSVQATILALRLHLARDAGDTRADDAATVEATRMAAMHAALAPRPQRGVR
jgi:group I intron endonuclease